MANGQDQISERWKCIRLYGSWGRRCREKRGETSEARNRKIASLAVRSMYHDDYERFSARAATDILSFSNAWFKDVEHNP